MPSLLLYCTPDYLGTCVGKLAAGVFRPGLLLLLEGHDGVSKAPVGVASPHGPEGLQEGDAISTLAECEGPQRWVLDERPRDIPDGPRLVSHSRALRVGGETDGWGQTYQVLLTSLLMSLGPATTRSPASVASWTYPACVQSGGRSMPSLFFLFFYRTRSANRPSRHQKSEAPVFELTFDRLDVVVKRLLGQTVGLEPVG